MPQFPNVSSPYGAPMGRRSDGLSAAGKVRLYRVRLNSGGYDDGGAYWGTGCPLWCAEDSEGNQRFTRAATRKGAAELLRIVDRLSRPLTARDD